MIQSFKRISKHRAKSSPFIRRTYYRLSGYFHSLRLAGTGLRSAPENRRGSYCKVNPENVVWIFCTSRSGSTWLRSMLAEVLTCKVWEEPKVGQLFGEFHSRAKEGQLGSSNFVMGDPTRKVWMGSLRNFVLETAAASHPSISQDQYLIVKEPDGAIGAPLLMEALPESRMILLVRDPRDVVASAIDATRKGGWMYEFQDASRRRQRDALKRLDDFVEVRAKTYLKNMSKARAAYETHGGRKVLVRYEDLVSDPSGTMRRICSALELAASEKDLDRVVGRYDWNNIPASEKGSGKFYRRGSPGGWREDLTLEQVEIVEKTTAPLLKAYYR